MSQRPGEEPPTADAVARCDTVLQAALDDMGLAYSREDVGSYLVRLEGAHKLATMTWLVAGRHSLRVEAFFCRRPDENEAGFYRYHLGRNATQVLSTESDEPVHLLGTNDALSSQQWAFDAVSYQASWGLTTGGGELSPPLIAWATETMRLWSFCR